MTAAKRSKSLTTVPILIPAVDGEKLPVFALRRGHRHTRDTGCGCGFRSDARGADDVLVVNLVPPSSLRDETDGVSGAVGIDYSFDAEKVSVSEAEDLLLGFGFD